MRVLGYKDFRNNYYYLENDSTEYDTVDFVSFLAKAHNENYEVRYINQIASVDRNKAFGVIMYNSKTMPRCEAFDLLWEYYTEE